MRHRAAWLIPLPLVVASWLGAHSLAYWLVSPGGTGHMALHTFSGHGYLGYAPAFAVWALALVLAGLVLSVGDGLRGRRPSPPQMRVFMILPPVGFAVQEQLERLTGTGGMPHDLLLEPTFLVGLALQLHFALAALLVAHSLTLLGFGIGRALTRLLTFPRQVPRLPSSPLLLPASVALAPLSVLALGHGPRAPPASCRS